MWLACEPGEQTLGGSEITVVRGPMVAAEDLCEGRVPLREVGELVLEPLLGRVGEAGIVLADSAQARDLVAYLIEPSFDDGLECVGPVGRGLELLDETPVDCLQAMERGVVNRDLHLGRRELLLARL